MKKKIIRVQQVLGEVTKLITEPCGTLTPFMFSQNCTLDTTLLGHAGLVSCLHFTSLHPLTIISLAHDRTFKVGMPAHVHTHLLTVCHILGVGLG